MRLWDPAAGKERITLQTGLAWCVAFSPDGKTLAVGRGKDKQRDWDDGGTVQLWDATGARLLRFLGRHAEWASGLAFAPDGRALAVAGSAGTLRLWDPATGRSLPRGTPGHPWPVVTVAWTAGGKTLASASERGAVYRWDVAADGRPGEERASRRGSRGMPLS